MSWRTLLLPLQVVSVDKTSVCLGEDLIFLTASCMLKYWCTCTGKLLPHGAQDLGVLVLRCWSFKGQPLCFKGFQALWFKPLMPRIFTPADVSASPRILMTWPCLSHSTCNWVGYWNHISKAVIFSKCPRSVLCWQKKYHCCCSWKEPSPVGMQTLKCIYLRADACLVLLLHGNCAQYGSCSYGKCGLIECV